jgi:phenylalanyl-tRNA synthetase beta chain
VPRVERLLGVPFTTAAVRSLLRPLGFSVSGNGVDADTLQVGVPGYRSYDVKREIDLVEEIARRHGFDVFPEALAPYRPGTVPDHPLFGLEDDLRRMLSERGLHEAQTPTFVPEGEGDVQLGNPISREESYLRSRLLPSLLRRVQHNFARAEGNVRIFEMATSFRAGERDGLPREAPHLGFALTGRRAPVHWSGDPGAFDLWDLKGLIEDLVTRAGLAVTLVPGSSEEPALVPDETLLMRSRDGRTIGWGGRVDPARMDAPAWAAPVWGFELELPASPASRTVPRHAALPAFPGVERDLALVVLEEVSAERVLEVLRRAGGEDLEKVEVFDLYRGKGVPGGSRSLAFRLRFQSLERTLTDAEVDRAIERVTKRLMEELNVRVRA